MRKGTLYGVGVGPGDPDLMTLKAARILQRAKVIAYFAKRGKESNARSTAASCIAAEAEQLALAYPFTVELAPQHPEYIAAMRAFYDGAAAQIARRLDVGSDVAVL